MLGDDAVDSAPFAGTDVVVERLAQNAVGELVPLVDLHHQLLADQPVETLDHPLFGNAGDRSDQVEFSWRHAPERGDDLGDVRLGTTDLEEPVDDCGARAQRRL